MTIPLIATGGLFTREGHILGFINEINAFRATSIPTAILAISQDFYTSDYSLPDGIFAQELSYQNSCGSIMSSLKQLASNIIVTMVNDDMLQPNNSLVNAMSYLVNQMKANSQSVKACTVSASTVAGGSNIGNLVVVTSMRTTGGHFLENSFAEVVSGKVVTDAQSGTAQPGSESVQFLGQQGVSDPLSWLYPMGSGCSVTIVAVNATIQSSGGVSNWLNNGNFESWTSNTPNGWEVSTGTPGTTILKSTAQFYDGIASCEFVGNGSEQTSIYTQFGTYQTANPNIGSTILPLSQYAFNLFFKVSSVPAAGVLTVSMMDQHLNTINDNLGSPNLVSFNLTTSSGAWQSFSGVFRMPAVIPTNVNLQFKLTTPLTGGVNLFIDHAAFTSMQPLYQGGPYVTIFSANTNSIKGDSYTITVSNDYGGGFQRGFDKLFNMKGLKQLLPSVTGSGATVPDSLITV